jgi:hypothetical protein
VQLLVDVQNSQVAANIDLQDYRMDEGDAIYKSIFSDDVTM